MRIVLGCHAALDGNEAKAALELLGLIDLKGAIVTADALLRRHDTAQATVEKRADYVLALKGNNPALLQEAQTLFGERPRKPYPPTGFAKLARLKKPRSLSPPQVGRG